MSTVAEESAAAIDAAKPAQGWPSPVYAWYVMAILIVAYSFAICDRSIISLLVQPIKADLHVTDAQIGLLQGLAFAICYTTFGLALGFITDRTDRRLLLAFSVFVWSAATVASAFSTSFRMLFISRIFVGLGEAGVLPVAGSLIADYLPPKSRARAYGMLLLGGTFGTLLGFQIGGHAIGFTELLNGVGWIGGMRPWQVAFVVAGVPGIAVAAMFALTVREPVRREKIEIKGFDLAPLFAHARVNWFAYATLLGSATLNVLCIYAQITWGPTFFIRTFGWSPEKVSTFMAISSVIGATSSVSVGWLMSRLIAKGWRDAPMMAALIHAGSLLILGTLAYASPTFALSATFYLTMSLTSNWSSSAALMGVSQITPNELRGQFTAFYTLLSGLISLSAGAYAVGVLSDRVFTGPAGVRYSLSTVYAIAGSLSVLLVFAGRPAFRAAAKRALAWAEPDHI